VSRRAIALCAPVERARWGPWETDAVLLPHTYALSVQAAGAVPLMVAPDERTEHSPDDVLDRVDALLLAGGVDLDPRSYGAEADAHTTGTTPGRDRSELALARRALERDMPVLGICRGMQLLNVACGGTLEQHLPDRLGHEEHRHTPGAFADHEVALEPDSLAARAAGTQHCAVKSHHHQGVAELGDGLVASGHSLPDGVIEAIEHPGHRFALGVLWHPEEDRSSRVIAALAAEVRAGAMAR
jgi:putative glutamine amidotransferase